MSTENFLVGVPRGLLIGRPLQEYGSRSDPVRKKLPSVEGDTTSSRLPFSSPFRFTPT